MSGVDMDMETDHIDTHTCNCHERTEGRGGEHTKEQDAAGGMALGYDKVNMKSHHTWTCHMP